MFSFFLPESVGKKVKWHHSTDDGPASFVTLDERAFEVENEAFPFAIIKFWRLVAFVHYTYFGIFLDPCRDLPDLEAVSAGEEHEISDDVIRSRRPGTSWIGSRTLSGPLP